MAGSVNLEFASWSMVMGIAVSIAMCCILVLRALRVKVFQVNRSVFLGGCRLFSQRAEISFCLSRITSHGSAYAYIRDYD